MRYRRFHGLPGLSINWGPWSETGMAAAMTERDRTRATEQGWSRIDPASGLDILGDLMRSNIAQVGVLPLHWGRFGNALFGNQVPGYLQAWMPKPTTSVSPQESGKNNVVAAILAASKTQREAMLHDYVTQTVADLLGHVDIDPEQGFANMGMDSLMGVDLRAVIQKGLGVSLASTFAFDYPNINAVVAYLSELMFRETADGSVDKNGVIGQSHELSDALDEAALSDVEIDDSIRAELAALESKLEETY